MDSFVKNLWNIDLFCDSHGGFFYSSTPENQVFIDSININSSVFDARVLCAMDIRYVDRHLAAPQHDHRCPRVRLYGQEFSFLGAGGQDKAGAGMEKAPTTDGAQWEMNVEPRYRPDI